MDDYLFYFALIPLKQTLTSAGLQVGGWIADKELALGKAIQQEFPQAPFQHCQSHFLAKMKAPLTEADTELGKTVKKNFGKLRPTERNITASAELGTINIEEAEQLQALCSTIRSWQSRSLSHKHRLKGVELYESMAQIADCIPSLRAEKDHSVLEELQIKLENSIAGLKTDYEALKQGKNVLDQLTDVLYGAKDEKGNSINFCKIPKRVRCEKENAIYLALLKLHCSHPSKKDQGHSCCGQITINTKTVTMSCVKCGDARVILD